MLATLPAAGAPIGTGSISGRVIDGNGDPIAGICVNVENGPGGQSDASGLYTISGLGTDGYKVGFSDCSPSPQFVSQWYLGHPDAASADVVPVTDGVDTPLPDVTLALGASISGTVTDTMGAPISGICVDVNTLSNGGFNWIAGATTGPGGTYTIGQLPAADVRVHFRDCTSGPYVEQWYDSQSDSNNATPIVLAPGEARGSVDAQLSTGIAVAGRVTDTSGNPIAGINVNVNPTGSGPSAWAQTDGSGRYTTGAVPAGAYRVQFQDSSPNPVWAAQYWNGKVSYSTATTLTLTLANAPVRAGVNATLSTGATVTGTVTAPGGGPAANVCVNAVIDTPNGPDWVGGTSTAPDGTYSMGGLPATAVKIAFQDCNQIGPYVEQWWSGRAGYSSANPLTLQPGATRSGIDAHLTAAARITGRVTDRAGHPLEGVCAQATTSSFVGGLAHTASDGTYAIGLSKGGNYKVQFVDCNATPEFAGRWWDNQPSAATAQAVTVTAGQTVAHIDAALPRGAVGTISGKVVNLNGIPMTSACVVAYLPNQYALFAPVNPDGTYTVPDVPSGTYALAFLGCSGEEPGAIVSDPQTSATSYRAVWWGGAPLELNDTDGGPDPIVQGATLVTVTPGQQLTGYDRCFGCTAIAIESIAAGNGSLTVSFTTPLLVSSSVAAGGVSAAADPPSSTVSGLTYTVTCSSTTGGVTGSASGPGSPITVTGLTPGATYACQVTASDGAIVVASSSPSVGVVSASANGSASGTRTVAFPTAAASGAMARTGASSADQARLGVMLLVLGLALTRLARSTRVGAVRR